MENSQWQSSGRPGAGSPVGSAPSAARTRASVGRQQKTYFSEPTTLPCFSTCWPQRLAVVPSAGHASIQYSTSDCA